MGFPMERGWIEEILSGVCLWNRVCRSSLEKMGFVFRRLRLCQKDFLVILNGGGKCILKKGPEPLHSHLEIRVVVSG